MGAWPLAKLTRQGIRGPSQVLYPPGFGRDRPRKSPLGGGMSQNRPRAILLAADPPLGSLIEGIGVARACSTADQPLQEPGFGGRLGAPGRPSTLAPRGVQRAPSALAWAVPATVVTWLILPVVICLSQRLSHACLSISNLYGETANGSLNQLSFI